MSKERGFDVGEMGESFAGNMGYLRHVMDPDGGERMGKANTNVVVHAGKLLALEEQDKPYAMSLSFDGDKNLETIRRETFDNQLDHVCTAHPRVDPITGEMAFFGYDINGSDGCYAKYSIADRNGNLVKTVPLDLPHPVMMHDMAITEHFAVFFDINLRFEIENAMKGKSPWVHHPEMPARFGILPRMGDASQLKWIETGGCSCFHIANAWEEGDTIVVVACRSNTVTMAPNVEKAMGVELKNEDIRARMHMWRINMTSGAVEERRLSDHFC